MCEGKNGTSPPARRPARHAAWRRSQPTPLRAERAQGCGGGEGGEMGCCQQAAQGAAAAIPAVTREGDREGCESGRHCGGRCPAAVPCRAGGRARRRQRSLRSCQPVPATAQGVPAASRSYRLGRAGASAGLPTGGRRRQHCRSSVTEVAAATLKQDVAGEGRGVHRLLLVPHTR